MIGVGRLEDFAFLALILGPLRAVLGHEILQRRLAADDGVDHLANRVVGHAQGRLGDLAQQRLLARDALEVLDQLRDDLLFRVGVDPVQRGDQQLREAVGDLLLARVQQRAEQRELRRLRVLAQMAGRLDHGAGAPAGDDIRRDAGEEVGG